MSDKVKEDMIFRESWIKRYQTDTRGSPFSRRKQVINPSLVTDNDCKEFLIVKGKGWVCTINNTIVGFSIVDLTGNNIWALFLRPEYEKMGIGKRLHDIILYYKYPPCY